MTTSDREVVALLEHQIAQRIGEQRYNLWFAGKTKFTWPDQHFVVGVPNHFYQEWLQNTFVDPVRAAAESVLGRSAPVRFVIDPELFQSFRKAQAQVAAGETSTAERPALPGLHEGAGIARQVRPKPERQPGPRAPRDTRRWRSLESFVVGPTNRVAHAAALSVVEEAGQAGNPLVLYGPVGIGKSHLLEGIYAGVRRHRPDWRVKFVSAEEFTNRFVQSMRLGKMGAFRKEFRDCDTFLLDDLHFLTTKRATQEEFLHTFNVLQDAGRQIVVTCDCHPRIANELMPELVDRLMGGAIWALLPPDRTTRLEILRSKCLGKSAPMPEEVLALLADQLHGNVRELEGALHTVQHYSRVAGKPIDLALAREALADLIRHTVRVVKLDDVDRAIREVLGLEPGALQSGQRNWSVSHPRMLAMYLARKYTTAAYREIGSYFGGRNHSTVLAAEKKIRQWLDENGHIARGQQQLPIREVLAKVERMLSR